MTATTTLPVLFATGIHSARPSASAVGAGGLYSCTTHSLVYQTDGVSTWATWASLSGTGLSDPMTTRGDVIVRNSSNATARLATGSANQYLGSDGTDTTFSLVTDAKLSTSDITTNNASTSKHGFAPKYPNDATKYLDGTGAYSVPAGGGGSGLLAVTSYSSGSDAQVGSGISNATPQDVDATNAKVVFTAPASGNVVVKLTGLIASTSGNIDMGIRESTTVLAQSRMSVGAQSAGVTFTASYSITGISAGSHTYKWALAGTGVGLYAGPNYGHAIMEVWSAP